MKTDIFKDSVYLVYVYKKIQETDKYNLQKEFYNGLVSNKNRIDLNEVEGYVHKIENFDYGRGYFD